MPLDSSQSSGAAQSAQLLSRCQHLCPNATREVLINYLLPELLVVLRHEKHPKRSDRCPTFGAVQMKTFSCALGAFGRGDLLPIRVIARAIATCSSRGRYGQRDQPYQANYQSKSKSSREFPQLRRLLSKGNFSLLPLILMYKRFTRLNLFIASALQWDKRMQMMIVVKPSRVPLFRRRETGHSPGKRCPLPIGSTRKIDERAHCRGHALPRQKHRIDLRRRKSVQPGITCDN